MFRFFAVLAACIFALTATAQDAPTGTITTGSTVASDSAIADRISDIIQELGGYEDVTVTVADGIVTLDGTTTSATEISALNALVNRVEGVVAIKNDVVETADLGRRLDPALDRFRARWEQFLANLPVVLVAIAVFAVILWIGTRIAAMRRFWARLAPNSFVADLYRQIVVLMFGLAGLVIALDILNATALLSTILGAAGIIGLALGFAVKDTVENYIASVMLSLRQPFRPNDVVEINGDQGKVIRLTSRATILLSFDGNHIRIPNATVFKSRIVNFSQNEERRFLFTLYVATTSDIGHARSLAAQTVQALPFVIQSPATESWIDTITESGVGITVAGWIDQNQTSINLARGEAIRQVKGVFESQGIEMPDTTYRIRVEGSLDQPTPTKPAAMPTNHAEISPVSAETDAALDRLINEERDNKDTEDLLDGGAKKE